jgi:ketosteroid isomerase-like protein
MSEENVEIVKAMIAAWNRRDLDGALSLAAPECTYVNNPAAVEPGTRHGRDGLAIVLRNQWEGLGPEAQQHIERVHPEGNEVIVAARVSRRMPGSDTELQNRVATRWTFDRGRLVQIEVLGAGPNFSEALRAAGLSE